MLSHKEQQLLDALAPAAAQNGVEIVTVEVVGSKKSPTIRVYIDTDAGVGFDELSSAQVWINEIMDRIDPFPGAYMLEVSSPGIDRPLRTSEHFARFVGERCVVKTSSPVDGRSTFSGTIAGVRDEEVTIDCDGERFDIAVSDMKKANLKGTIDFGA